jgi:lipopolysaccharide export LptBFGC system permease protein LptF
MAEKQTSFSSGKNQASETETQTEWVEEQHKEYVYTIDWRLDKYGYVNKVILTIKYTGDNKTIKNVWFIRIESNNLNVKQYVSDSHRILWESEINASYILEQPWFIVPDNIIYMIKRRGVKKTLYKILRTIEDMISNMLGTYGGEE